MSNMLTIGRMARARIMIEIMVSISEKPRSSLRRLRNNFYLRGHRVDLYVLEVTRIGSSPDRDRGTKQPGSGNLGTPVAFEYYGRRGSDGDDIRIGNVVQVRSIPAR